MSFRSNSFAASLVRVDIVCVEARSDRAPDQPGVKRIRAVLDEHGAGRKALKALNDERHGRRAVQRCRVDAVNASRIRIDPVVAVHQGLEAHQMLAHREGDSAELHEMVRRLAGGLAVERDEMQRLDRRLWRWPFR